MIQSATMYRSASSFACRYQCLRYAAATSGRLGRRCLTTPAQTHDEGATRLSPQPRPVNPSNPLSSRQEAQHSRAQYKRRMSYAGAGFAVAFIGLVGLSLANFGRTVGQPIRTEAPPGSPPFEALLEHEGLVKTGSDAVPFFPRTITLPSTGTTTSAALPVGTGAVDDEYQLIGLGVRTVSFLSIKVYVVGLYVASADMATLQARFVRRAADVESASALVTTERDRLRQRLGDPEQGQELWNAMLKDGGIRSAVRIVPTRSTDFAHLKDGWLRAIQSRSRAEIGGETFVDESFGKAVDDFKQTLGRGSFEKGKVLVLARGANGLLSLWLQQGDAKPSLEKAGELADERISRLIWLNYLAGKQVASEAARTSIINGVMEMVSRPIGSVETKVV